MKDLYIEIYENNIEEGKSMPVGPEIRFKVTPYGIAI
jgi:hypothetical protein